MSKFKPGDVVGACFDAGIYYGTVVDPSEKLDPPPSVPLSGFTTYPGYTWVRVPNNLWNEFFFKVLTQPQNAALAIDWAAPYVLVKESTLSPALMILTAAPIKNEPTGVFCQSCGVKMEFANLAWKCPKCWRVL